MQSPCGGQAHLTSSGFASSCGPPPWAAWLVATDSAETSCRRPFFTLTALVRSAIGPASGGQGDESASVCSAAQGNHHQKGAAAQTCAQARFARARSSRDSTRRETRALHQIARLLSSKVDETCAQALGGGAAWRRSGGEFMEAPPKRLSDTEDGDPPLGAKHPRLDGTVGTDECRCRPARVSESV